ncbi:unnamed protein product [Microthlaspi erraticum]|uniref:MATH domain-containing protein n=1 Tax=Microthlaspi erraticum TaxID=1685480 RepID=A0A6D2JVV3_9BRAS|nr:unnamed protein product [Microthlaspi erraticum]
MSARDYKLSASNTVKGLRDRPPSSYSLKIESFNTLFKSKNIERYESRPFSAAGYNWTLVVYPNENKTDKDSGYLSLCVTIDNSTLSPHQEVYVDLRFYVFNRKEKKYFTIQDVFSVGGRDWNIQVNPSGRVTGEGKALSIYLILNANEKFRPYEKIYVRAKLRLLNQRSRYNNIEKQLDNWFNGPGYGDGFGWGSHEFISLSDLKDSSKGFLVNDTLMAQVDIEVISSTKYFPK